MTKADKPKYVTVFTDASHCDLTNVSGWAVWIKYGSPAVTVRLSGVTDQAPGSNGAEVFAIRRALDYLERHREVLSGAKVIIQSDSSSAILKCEFAARTLKRHGAEKVELRWVKGHQGARCPRSAVNTWCDKEARKLMRKERDRILRGAANG